MTTPDCNRDGCRRPADHGGGCIRPPRVFTRWACDCGRFIADSAIREQNFRDDSYYYGVRTETEFDCSRCGPRDGEPRLIVWEAA